MTETLELPPKRYPEKAMEYLNEHFPKGDKRRGEAMVLLGIAFLEGKRGD